MDKITHLNKEYCLIQLADQLINIFKYFLTMLFYTLVFGYSILVYPTFYLLYNFAFNLFFV